MRRNLATSFAVLGLMAAPMLAPPTWAQGSTPRDTSNSGSSSVGKGSSSSPAVTPPRSGSTPRDNSGSGSSAIGHGTARSPAVTPAQPGATPRDESGSGSSARGGPGTGPVR
ncbi:Hypothetical protein HVPorG_01774 [Roseomonas mucosa]|uniref:Uncharacterized protein n=1 Tax=Roseomonas mucosa TaxID=207340 RepID=A0A379N552_9PROT|nr:MULTISPECIES: hypothetical protein [Roseomonas]MBS5901221.1 hypothetical protein [Acetobacteraceae bacterium]MDT8263855.1 hypothetical protein [Roseomonas sp. DSM 102946]ATR20383.1 hypothetical protein CTJ15_08745 [Roseomonas sp. FDAARGOS_362]MCG7351081.1 hypothetical protein [Roseomonas mucosa]MCG7355540.1 hypothetical protein [Roseomonas mucosa]